MYETRIAKELRRRLIDSHIFLMIYNYLHFFPADEQSILKEFSFIDKEIVKTAISDGLSMGWLIERNGKIYAVPLFLLPFGILNTFLIARRSVV